MRFHIVIICSFLSGYLPAPGQQLFVQQYPVEIHKGSTQNWCMAQDRQGNIYIANTDGVLTYDGVQWNLITLPNKEYVLCLGIDADDRIYIGSYGELGYLQKDGGGAYAYHSLMPRLAEEDREKVREIRQMAIAHDAVFFNDGAHIYRYADGRFSVLKEESNGFLYYKKQLHILRKDGIYAYSNGHFQKAAFPPEMERKGILWVADYGPDELILLDNENDLSVFNPDAPARKNLRPLSAGLNTRLENRDIHKVLALADGRMAILLDRAIWLVDKNGGILNMLTEEMLGSEPNSPLLYEDTHHNLWMATSESIVQLITSSPLAFYDKLNGLKGSIYAIGKYGDDLYAGTGYGLYRKNADGNFTLVPHTEGEVWNLYNIGQKLYMAHGTGVFEIGNKKAEKIIDHSYVHALCNISRQPGCLIMGTYNTGIWRLKKQGNTWQKKKIEGFEEETRYLEEDGEGNIWISHYNKGIWKLRMNEAMDSILAMTFYDQAKGLPSNLENRVHRLHNREIVATTEDGIYRYNPAGDVFEPYEKFAQAMGKGLCMYQLTESPNGDIYFRGKRAKEKEAELAGALIRQPDDTYKLLLTPFRKITWVDNDPPLFAAADNRIWFGNYRRIISYNPARKTLHTDSLRLFIKQVVAKDSLIYTPGRGQVARKLPYAKNSLHFEFITPFFENPEKTEYQYKLIGFADEWSAWSPAREAVFTNLPKGDYTFAVRARNIYRSISPPAYFTFHIDPPWYRTLVAYLLYVLTLLILLYFAIVIKTKQVERQKKLLQKEVTEKTNELLAVNEEILTQNEEISAINEEINKKNFEIASQAEELMKSNFTKDKIFSIISHDLRGPVNQLHELFTLVETGHVSADEFRALVPSFKEKVRNIATLMENLLQWAKNQMEGIQVKPTEFNLPEIVEENINLFRTQAHRKKIQVTTTIDANHSVFADKDMASLILRNLVSNAIKFTPEKGKVDISVHTSNTHAHISVADTGTGLSEEEIARIFDNEFFTKYGTAGEKGAGIGLMLCREFTKKIGGTFSIEGSPGRGSRFTFSIPLNNTI